MQNTLLQTPIDYLKGVGPGRAEVLRKELGIRTYQDLINLFPNRYIDRTQFYQVSELQPSNAEVQIVGQITGFKELGQKRGKRLVATFRDETGYLELVWFRGHKWIREQLKTHTDYVIFGKVNLLTACLACHIQTLNSKQSMTKAFLRRFNPSIRPQKN